MNLMVPVLAAYIAESIGKRPALVPGFVAGMIAIQGLPVNPATGLIDAGGSGVGFGFLGGIVGGFLAGYVILLLEKVFAKLPANLNGLKAIFLYPLFSTLIVGLVMLGISGPMVTINNAMMDFLRSLQHAGAIPLGIAIGCMCAVDMGGPVNKAAYVTGTMLLGAGLEAGIANDSDALLAAFLKRESEGTTGMVDGYAIPHAKTDAVVRPAVVVLKAADGVAAWDTMDGAPVTCAIALLVPESQAGTAHLQILSKVATALTDDVFRAACKAEDDPAKVAGLINERLA